MPKHITPHQNTTQQKPEKSKFYLIVHPEFHSAFTYYIYIYIYILAEAKIQEQDAVINLW